ncbi:entericidin A/B family lipoprotein [Silanimonas sp.]|jgi:predicted small secreted protein|nr:entericidin A/B family lipoprotein [Silanimonas sp.]MCZ8061970.1 entericidin A/B family lipoprotein [Silanimonas sp.]
MKIRLFTVAALALLALTACNTISGIGKDVKKAGEVVTREAEEAKN